MRLVAEEVDAMEAEAGGNTTAGMDPFLLPYMMWRPQKGQLWH